MIDASRAPQRIGTALTAAALAAVTFASSALGGTTIGQLAPGSPPVANCEDPSETNTEIIEPTVTSGTSYVVPAGGVAITSWSTNATFGAGQQLKMKVWRKVAEPAIYQVVGHDGPRTLTPGTLNTFPVNLPTQPGDLIGLIIPLGSALPTACAFQAPGNTVLRPAFFGDLGHGEARSFSVAIPDVSLNLSAVVGFKTSNDIDFVKVKKNKRKGTAALTVDVPGPGQLSLSGTGVKAQRAGWGQWAVASKTVEKAGPVTLRVKSKGTKKAKLNDRGKVKVKVNVTFTPNAPAAGDLAGNPNTETKSVRLKRIQASARGRGRG